MLAAMVVLLLSEFFKKKSELRVVYIPDCARLMLHPFLQLQMSLLLAFADDADSCDVISKAETIQELTKFVMQCEAGTLLLVVDQYNALSFPSD
jgi:hypothetical protein